MVKKGPCCHCGISSTPLWRNGPPEKPVLCNACGSRWRTKGTLTNYTPLHSRDEIELEDTKATRLKNITFKVRKHMLSKELLSEQTKVSFSNQNFRKIQGEKIFRSINDSTLSKSEYFGNIYASPTASSQSDVWEPLVPSKKRTHVGPKPSPLEKLTKDLYSIMQHQSHLTVSTDGDLLYNIGTQDGSSETGYGSMLIRQLRLDHIEEESEASPSFYSLDSEEVQDKEKRHKSDFDNLREIHSQESLLIPIELESVFNFETFMEHFTHEEQQYLQTFLPATDSGSLNCIESMFGCSWFKGMISTLQKMIQERVHFHSLPGSSSDHCESFTYFSLENWTASRWLEFFAHVDEENNARVMEREVILRPCFQVAAKWPGDGQINRYTKSQDIIRNVERVHNSGCPLLLSDSSSQLTNTESSWTFHGNCEDQFDQIIISESPQHRKWKPITPSNNHCDFLLEDPCDVPIPGAVLLFHPASQKPKTDRSPSRSEYHDCEDSFSDYSSSALIN